MIDVYVITSYSQAVWPDVGIKSSQKLSNVDKEHLFTKWCVWKVAKYLDYFFKDFQIAQFGHTVIMIIMHSLKSVADFT